MGWAGVGWRGGEKMQTTVIEQEKLIGTNSKGELPQSGKGNRLPGSPGSSENPKEIGLREEHTKTYNNYPRLKMRES